MKSIILAAGYAIRMYPLTKDRPKALLNIAGKPLINYLLKKVDEIEVIDEIFIVTNNKFYDLFCEWLYSYGNIFSKKIRIINDGTNSNEDRLGGIGDLGYCIDKIGIEEDLLVLNGDNLFDFSLKGAIDSFNGKNIINGVYLMKDINETKRHGVVELNGNHIISFEEKPLNPKSLFISIGVYIFPKFCIGDILEFIKTNENKDAQGYLIKHFVESSEVHGFLFNGKLYDIGNLESYNKIKDNWENG